MGVYWDNSSKGQDRTGTQQKRSIITAGELKKW